MEHTVQLENESGENPALKTAVIGVLIAFMYYVSSVYIYIYIYKYEIKTKMIRKEGLQ